MSHENKKPLTDFESALAALSPARAAVDRDRLMYLAGRAAARAEMRAEQSPRRTAWLWPSMTAGMTIAALFFGALLMFQSRSAPAPIAVPNQNDRERSRPESTIDDSHQLARAPSDRFDEISMEDLFGPRQRVSLGVGIVPPPSPAASPKDRSEFLTPRSVVLLDEL